MTQPRMEEEHRLAYVALTRTEKGLYLSEMDGLSHDGEMFFREGRSVSPTPPLARDPR